eukprot:4927414-Prymnesium_polylepis.2
MRHGMVVVARDADGRMNKTLCVCTQARAKGLWSLSMWRLVCLCAPPHVWLRNQKAKEASRSDLQCAHVFTCGCVLRPASCVRRSREPTLRVGGGQRPKLES